MAQRQTTISTTQVQTPTCGSASGALGAALLTTAFHAALGLVTGVVGMLVAGRAKNGTIDQKVTALRQGTAVAAGLHGVTAMAVAAMTAETHPHFAGASMFMGTSAAIAAVAVAIPPSTPAITEAPTQGLSMNGVRQIRSRGIDDAGPTALPKGGGAELGPTSVEIGRARLRSDVSRMSPTALPFLARPYRRPGPPVG